MHVLKTVFSLAKPRSDNDMKPESNELYLKCA